MKKVTFKSYEELPLTLSVPEMAAALGISRAGAYELARTENRHPHRNPQGQAQRMGR